MDGNISGKSHIDYLSVKSSIANVLLFKIRNLVNSSILTNIYFSIFESHLSYCSLVWSHNCNAINRLIVRQKNLLELLTFSHVTPTPVLYLEKVLF